MSRRRKRLPQRNRFRTAGLATSAPRDGSLMGSNSDRGSVVASAGIPAVVDRYRRGNSESSGLAAVRSSG